LSTTRNSYEPAFSLILERAGITVVGGAGDGVEAITQAAEPTANDRFSLWSRGR